MISVVIPVLDDAPLLERCLAALGRQTEAGDEIIVVDNGSNDASAVVARLHGATVVHCREPGIPAASAAGYDAARGDVIARVDADCVPGPEWIATIRRAFDADPSLAAITGGARFVDGPPTLRRPLANAYLAAYRLAAGLALAHPPLFGSNLALRASVWRRVRDEVHRHDPVVHDDFDLAYHVGRVGRIRVIRELDMGMAFRPFTDLRGFGLRVWRGIRTVAVHLPREAPPVRWARRVVPGHRRTLERVGVDQRRDA